MTPMVNTSADSDRAAEIRNALTDQLCSDGMITSPVVTEHGCLAVKGRRSVTATVHKGCEWKLKP